MRPDQAQTQLFCTYSVGLCLGRLTIAMTFCFYVVAQARTELFRNRMMQLVYSILGIYDRKLRMITTGFLCDSCAHIIQEAITWHGSEAETAKQNSIQLNRAERQAILAFLNYL